MWHQEMIILPLHKTKTSIMNLLPLIPALVLFAGILVSGGPLSTGAASPVDPVPREGRAHERFLELNERVREQAGEVTLLFVGDSITQGWETTGREVWEEFYGGRDALNIGISGDRTQHVLWRLENGNIDGLSPKVSVIMIGTNNSGLDRNTTGEMLEGVTAVVERIGEELPDTRVLLLGIFPRGRHFDEQRGKITQVNQALRLLEDGERVFFLDFGHVFLNADGSIPEALMPDALHLSSEGYLLWAESMEKKLAALLQD